MRKTTAVACATALVLQTASAAAQQSQAIEVPLPPPAVAVQAEVPPDSAAAAELVVPAAQPLTEPAPVMTLGEVIELGLARNPGLQALEWQAWSLWAKSRGADGYDDLNANLTVTSLLTDSPLGVFGSRLSQGRVTQADFDPAVLNDPDYLGNTELKLSLVYPLYDADRSELAAAALAQGGEALEYQQLAAGQQLVGTLIETYFAHALLTDQLVVLQQAQETADELWRMIASLQREGLVTRSDVAAAEVELANIRHQITQAQARLALTETTISTLAGVDYAFSTSVPDIYGVVAMPELAAITEIAIAEHPAVCAALANAESAGLMLTEARRQRHPTVGLFAEAKHSSPGLIDDGHLESTVGAQLNFSLDTNGVIRNTIEERAAQEQSALWYHEQVAEGVKLGVAAAYAELSIAYQAVETFAAQSAKAAENFRVVNNQYREGLTNYLDLRLALTTRTESSLREIKSRHDYATAYFRLLVSAGLAGTEHDPVLGAGAAQFEPLRLELEPQGVTDADN